MPLFEHIDDSVFLCEYIYSVYFVLFSATITLISTNRNSVMVLNETNLKAWKENMKIVLGCMDFNLN